MNAQHDSIGGKWALLALAIGAFSIGTTEFTPMGLLPVIASGVDVSIPAAGLLVSVYAIGVMIGAPIITLAFGRLGKRTALMLLMGIFILGNLASALAPNYEMLLLSRLLTSLNHGAFFGLGSLVAASLVSKDKQAAAIATMFLGLTIANIGGVPAATWIGQQIGWRPAFAAIAALGLVSIVALAIALPKGEPGKMPNIQQELRVLLEPAVLIALATTALGSAAMFTLYTYIAPTLIELTDASEVFITVSLVLIGIGFSVGNIVGGRLADWSLEGAMKIFLVLLVVIMLLLPFLLTTHVGAVIGLLAWGVAAFALVPPVQTRVMRAASGAPGLASSVNVGAFNLGNAIGAAVGGIVIDLGWGYPLVPVAGAMLAIAALLLVMLGQKGLAAGAAKA